MPPPPHPPLQDVVDPHDPSHHHHHGRAPQQYHQPHHDQQQHAPPDLDVDTPREGSTYPDFEALRFAVNSWALRDKFLTRIHKKDQTRAIYQCRHFAQGCPWKLRATINKDTGVLTVSSVIPEHTCSRDVYEDADGKPKYAKRGVQYTQRWVKDAIQRANFTVTMDTEPRQIVELIRERFGEDISERLAAKSKQSLLEARGEAIPRRPSHKPGRPSNAAVEERQRDMQAAMEESRRVDRMARESQALGFDINGNDINGDPLPQHPQPQQDRPFVFESGVRVIGPASPPRSSNNQRRQTLPTTLTDYSYNSGFGGPTSATSSTTRASAMPVSPAMETRTCPKCSGSGIVRAPPNSNGTSTVNGADNNNDDDELGLLQKQVALISKQITLMQRKRQQQNGAG